MRKLRKKNFNLIVNGLVSLFVLKLCKLLLYFNLIKRQVINLSIIIKKKKDFKIKLMLIYHIRINTNI